MNVTPEEYNMSGVTTEGSSTIEGVTITSLGGAIFFTSTVAFILYNIIGVVGAICNLLVVIVIASSKLRKTYFNMFILNQSCIDVVVNLVLIGVANLTGNVGLNGSSAMAYCLLWQSRLFVWGLLISSTYNLVALTLERYTEVVHPIWHRNNLNGKKVLISVICIWVVSLVIQGIPLFATTRIINKKCVTYTVWPSRGHQQLFGIVWVFLKLFIPVVILTYAYCHIAMILHDRLKINPVQPNSAQTSSGTSSGNSSNSRDARLARARHNTIKTLFIVSICFFVCWAPNQIYFFMMNVGYPPDYSSNFYHFTVYLVYINGCLNPIIYGFQYEEFQKVARNLLCWFNKRETIQYLDASQTNSEVA